jgi:CDP-diacylglycerol--glycerol-3-phosphate 3-phosphatidyltransferase
MATPEETEAAKLTRRERKAAKKAAKAARRRRKPRQRPLRPFQQEISDLPNLLTLFRILTLPAVLALIDNYSPVMSLAATAVFILGAITDVLDGYLARKRGQESVLGAFLDPLADKLFVLGTLVYLSVQERVPAWLVVVLMSRELAITMLRTIAISYGLIIAAGASGKAKTALQSVGIILLLMHFKYHILVLDFELDCHKWGTIFIYMSLVMSVWSAGEYFRFFVLATEEKVKRQQARIAAQQAAQAAAAAPVEPAPKAESKPEKT